MLLKQIQAKARVGGTDLTFTVTFDHPVEVENHPMIEVNFSSDDPELESVCLRDQGGAKICLPLMDADDAQVG
jgi:hypothetical protein